MKKKVVAAIMSVALVAAVGIGGTLAYLSAKTDTVENTFAVGAGFVPGPDGSKGIVLDETKVDITTGEPVGDERTTSNAYADLLPGDVRLKDPTVHMVSGSVDSYVFIKVEGADELAQKGISISDFNFSDWQKMEGAEESDVDGIYIYKGTKYSQDDGKGYKKVVVNNLEQADGTLADLSKVFTEINVKKDMTQEELDKLMNQLGTLAVQAVAVQADNNNAADALEEAKDVAGWN